MKVVKSDIMKFHSLCEDTPVVARIHHVDRNVRDQRQLPLVADDRLEVVYGTVEALNLLHDRYCA